MIDVKLVVDTPYVNIKEFSKRSGLPENTIRKLVNEGRLPIRKKTSAKGMVLINLAALNVEALKDAED